MIMVEIRDRETADVAIRSSLTGRFVFSTLHTNDAPSAITRLTDMGMENYLITSSVVAVLAQRLVRVICEHCKAESGGAHRAGWKHGRLLCWPRLACFRIRLLGPHGHLRINGIGDEWAAFVVENAPTQRPSPTWRGATALRNLREDGWLKVMNGVTTADEVMRVAQEF